LCLLFGCCRKDLLAPPHDQTTMVIAVLPKMKTLGHHHWPMSWLRSYMYTPESSCCQFACCAVVLQYGGDGVLLPRHGGNGGIRASSSLEVHAVGARIAPSNPDLSPSAGRSHLFGTSRTWRRQRLRNYQQKQQQGVCCGKREGWRMCPTLRTAIAQHAKGATRRQHSYLPRFHSSERSSS